MKLSRPSPRSALATTALAVAATAFLAPVAASPVEPAPLVAPAPHDVLPTGPLDILLTNDDGYDAPGIGAVYEALVAAGHHVTMVSPSRNYSGVSASIRFTGTTSATHPVNGDEDKWAVDLSPASTVFFGLDVALTEQPDLVISGTNVGANTGFDTNFSGTVGAATVASGMFDIPAIAVSTETVWGQEADAAYDETAELIVDLLDRGLPRLPRGQFLNVNYPLVGGDHPDLQGIRYATSSPASAASFRYESADDPGTAETEYQVIPSRGSEVHPAGSDADLLAQGWVTVSVFDADRSVESHEVPAVAKLVRELERAGVN